MNMLSSPLPDTVWVGGMEFELDTDFRTWIQFELLMQDTYFTESEKAAQALQMAYFDTPSHLTDAVNQIMWFYSCGKEQKDEAAQSETTNTGGRVYDFAYDDGYIYAAFLSQYGIDLTEIPYLHWWKFRALFYALDEHHEFCKIMSYRTADISKIEDSDKKQLYRDLKRMYALPDERTDEQKEQDFINSLLSGL